MEQRAENSSLGFESKRVRDYVFAQCRRDVPSAQRYGILNWQKLGTPSSGATIVYRGVLESTSIKTLDEKHSRSLIVQ